MTMQHFDHPEDWIRHHYGDEAVADFRKAVGGATYYIQVHKPKDVLQAYIEEHYGEESERQIARKFGVCERTIERRLDKKRQKTPTPLFG